MTNEYMIALPLFQWVQLNPLAKMTYSQKCSCAAMFWMRCLNGRYDICDSKSRRAQAALVRPYFDRWAQAFACGADKATTGKMWDAIVSDVRNCAGILKGRELGMINDLTYQKIGDGSIGHAEIAKMAIEVSKEQQRVEAAATDNIVVDLDAARAEVGVVEEGVEPSHELDDTAVPTAKAAATSCGYVDELKSKAAEMGLSASKMARVMIEKQRSDLMDVCAGAVFGSTKQIRRLNAAAELVKRMLHPRARRIQGGGPSEEESSEDDEEDESHVFAGMDGTSVVAAVRMSEAIGRVAAFANSTVNAGFYRQNEECEWGRRRRRMQRVHRIQGGGDGGEDGQDGDEMDKSDDVFEPEAEGEVTFQVGHEIQSGATTQRRGAHGFEKPCSINMGKGVYDIEAFCEAVESGRRHLTKDFVRYYLYNFGRTLWDMALPLVFTMVPERSNDRTADADLRLPFDDVVPHYGRWTDYYHIFGKSYIKSRSESQNGNILIIRRLYTLDNTPILHFSNFNNTSWPLESLKHVEPAPANPTSRSPSRCTSSMEKYSISVAIIRICRRH